MNLCIWRGVAEFWGWWPRPVSTYEVAAEIALYRDGNEQQALGQHRLLFNFVCRLRQLPSNLGLLTHPSSAWVYRAQG